MSNYALLEVIRLRVRLNGSRRQIFDEMTNLSEAFQMYFVITYSVVITNYDLLISEENLLFHGALSFFNLLVIIAVIFLWIGIR